MKEHQDVGVDDEDAEEGRDLMRVGSSSNSRADDGFKVKKKKYRWGHSCNAMWGMYD